MKMTERFENGSRIEIKTFFSIFSQLFCNSNKQAKMKWCLCYPFAILWMKNGENNGLSCFASTTKVQQHQRRYFFKEKLFDQKCWNTFVLHVPNRQTQIITYLGFTLTSFSDYRTLYQNKINAFLLVLQSLPFSSSVSKSPVAR